MSEALYVLLSLVGVWFLLTCAMIVAAIPAAWFGGRR